MPWCYEATIEGVQMDIEYTQDSDIETGESWINLEGAKVGGVEVLQLLYTIDENNTEEMLVAAIRQRLAEDKRFAEAFDAGVES